MDYKNKYKAFHQALEILNKDHRRFKSFYLDKRITRFEKKLLTSILNIKKGSSLQAINTLINIKSECYYLEGIKYNYLGYAYNNTAQHLEAISSFKEAIDLFSTVNAHNYIYKPHSALIIALINQKKFNDAQAYFESFNNYKLITKEFSFLYLQTKACLYTYIGKESEAIEAIEKCFHQHSDIVNSKSAYLQGLKLVCLFKLKKIDSLFEELQAYKSMTGYKVKQNYKYIYSLAHFIFNDTKFYSYLPDYESIPLLYHELNVVQSLSSLDKNSAEESWKFLQTKNPDTYADKFIYHGGYTFFSIALQKALIQYSESLLLNNSSSQIKDLKLSRIQKDILTALISAQEGISKYDLYQKVWGEEPEDNRLVRLTTQISRLRKKLDQEIIVRNGKYFIQKAS